MPPINVEEELAKLALADIDLQSQITALSECCATCGLNGGVDVITAVHVIGGILTGYLCICIGFQLGKR